MVITTRQFLKSAYTHKQEFKTLQEFDRWYSGLTGYMELTFNGVKFMEKGNLDIDCWNNRSELLDLK